MPVMDEFKEERESIKNKSFKEKLDYFWYYYKVHTIVGIFVLILAIVFIRDAVNKKDYAYYCTFLNSFSMDAETGFMDEFAKTTDVDLDKFEVRLDDTTRFSLDGYDQTSMAMVQRFVAMIYAGDIDNAVMEKSLFTNYAKNETFMDLRQVLTPEQIEKYKDHFYYIDRAEFDAAEEADFGEIAESNAPVLKEDTVDRKNPEAMKDPIPVGIFIEDDLRGKITEYGFYPEDEVIVFGFLTETHADLGRQFLDWLTD